MFLRVLFLSLLLTVLASCSGGGHSSEESLTKAYLRAYTEKDGAAARALFPSDKLLSTAFTCPDSGSWLIKKERDKAAGWQLQSETSRQTEWTSMEERFGGFIAPGVRSFDEVRPVLGIDRPGNCSVNMGISWKKVRIHYIADRSDGKKKSKSKTVRMVKFGDGGWHLIRG